MSLGAFCVNREDWPFIFIFPFLYNLAINKALLGIIAVRVQMFVCENWHFVLHKVLLAPRIGK
jgi:hypothetical protein